MTVANGNISDCKFIHNFAGSGKIYNNFEAKRLTLDIRSSVLINNCLFEVDHKSTSSFFYVRGDKHEVPIEVYNYIYTGNLSNAHFIDGALISGKFDTSKLQIKYCIFSSNRTSAINKKSHALASLFSSFDENLQEFEYKETKKVQSNLNKKNHFASFVTLKILINIFLSYFYAC